MTGILIIDKPSDFTSFDVIAKLRGICATRRIGHSGTLDPMATGVLPVFIGEATKAVDMQVNHDKVYEATFLLGTKTNTADITGEVIEKREVPKISEQLITSTLESFVGECSQVPPMYSAVKINGVPLYKLARKGEEIEREARNVTIYALNYLGAESENEHKIRVHCSKGTYVRTLIEDIAQKLGTVATMTALRRTMAGAYTIENAHTLSAVQQAKDSGTLEQLPLSISTVFEHLPKLTVNTDTYKRLLNGAPTYKFRAKDGEYSVYIKSTQQGKGMQKTENVMCDNTKNSENNDSKSNHVFIGICSVTENVLNAKKIFVREVD